MEPDDDALAETETEAALRALEELAAMGERGDFDVLLDKANYRR
ncbi:hypothetical protein [Streptomyces venezuelae]|nr:hypothetical protein [Streptomyces venezuelae]